MLSSLRLFSAFTFAALLGLGSIAQGGSFTVECSSPPLEHTYCYAANDIVSWTYSASGAGSLKLIFDRGTIESSTYEDLVIYDGQDSNGPILWEHTTGTTNLGPPGSAINSTLALFQSVEVLSTSGFIHMALDADGIVQCATSTTYDPWEWRVFCLDCTAPQVVASIVEECEFGSYEIQLDVISTGDGPNVSIEYTADGETFNITGVTTGNTMIGPFLIGTSVNVIIHHASDTLCDVSLGDITDSGNCPTVLVCGAPAIEETYCYGPNDLSSWLYQGDMPGTLRLTFIRGTIQSTTFDRIRIYDGTDNTAPLLFSHTETATHNLGPPGSAINNTLSNFHSIDVFANSGSIYMEMESNATTHCGATASYDPWEWNVVCLNCTMPSATVTIEDDCPNDSFNILVDVSSTGDGGPVSLEYTIIGGSVFTLNGVNEGITTLGPFSIGQEVEIIMHHGGSVLCDVPLGTFTDGGICPLLITCGAAAIEETYCYGANEFTNWLYTATGPGTLRLYFIQGTIQSATFDRVRIYDGVDNTAPLAFAHTQTATYNLGPAGSAVNNTFTNFHSVDVYATSGSLYMELESNGTTHCGATATYDPWIWRVVCLDCTLPAATVSVEDDCPNDNFSVHVDVSDTGDGGATTLAYTVNGGSVTLLPGVGTGVTTLGPFPMDDVIDITIQHGSSDACDVHLGVFTDGNICPVMITCGAPAIDQTHCYGPNEFSNWLYTADGAGTLRLYFLRGTIQSATFDDLRIHDGTNSTAPLVFSHTQTAAYNLGPAGSAINNTFSNYHSIDVFSTSGSIYMEMESNGTTQCSTTATYDAWEWRVVCLDCALPAATATVVDDCATNSFNVILDVSSIGDGGPVTLAYVVDGGTEELVIGVNTGTTTLGPFPVGSTVEVSMNHGNNELCDVDLGSFTDNNTCPTLVNCGGDLVEETYCYMANDSQHWLYEAVGSGTLRLIFIRGTIESNTFEDLTIYDGQDATGTVLFDHTTGTTNLGPPGSAINSTNTLFQSVDVVASSGFIYMEMSSDGSVQCATSSTYDAWEWQVVCLDCLQAQATFEIVQDCVEGEYEVIVDVTGIGSSSTAVINNDLGLPPISITGPGEHVLGPIESGTSIQITISHDSEPLCDLVSPNIVNPICPEMLCGVTPMEETYCYGANEFTEWAYEVPEGGQLRLTFQRGTIQSSTFDDLTIYDGPDALSPVIFSHNITSNSNLGPDGSAINNNLANNYGVDILASGTNLYMVLTSNGTTHCGTTTSFDAWEWTVQCEGCAAPGVEYTIVADCEHLIYKALVEVDTILGPLGLQITEMTGGESVTLNAPGAHLFETFDLDEPIYFEVMDLDNSGCVYVSDTLTYTREDCIIESCGIDNYTVCYENDEDRWYTFRSTGDFPVAIYFHQGQMLGANDRIMLYNGTEPIAGPPSNLIYSGNNAGNLTGFAANSSNADNALTLNIISDGSGSCEDGQATTPLNWDIGCGAVGIEGLDSNTLSIYPNPTNSQLHIDLGNSVLNAVQLRIFDMSGRVAYERIITTPITSLDLSELQNGQYVVQVISEEFVATRPFQVQR